MKVPWSRLSSLLLPLLLSPTLQAATPDLRPQEGLRENTPKTHALVGARVVPRPGETLDTATVILRDGLIVDVGPDVTPPEDARVWDLQGMTIYPGFIDAYAILGENRETPEELQEGHWNASVRSYQSVLDQVSLEESDLEKRRELGFTTAHLAPRSGALRGQGALIQLTKPDDLGLILNREAAQHFAFVTTSKDYPRSLMGCIALMRQTLSDAQWYQRYQQVYQRHPDNVRPGEKEALSALSTTIKGPRKPAFFRLGNEIDIQRAIRIADEFKLKRVLVDPGYGYRCWKPLKRGKNNLVLSLAFPEAPSISDPDRALDISLERLQHWDAAPSNPAILQNHGIAFALSTYRLEKKLADFWPNLRHAIQHGLKESTALDSLTRTPARLLGEEKRLGEIAGGRVANLVVTSGNPFLHKEAKIRQVWIDGSPWLDELDRLGGGIQGTWETAWTGVEGPRQLEFSGSDKKPKLTVPSAENDAEVEATVTMAANDALSFTLPAKLFAQHGEEEEGTVRLSGYLNTKTIVGQGALPDGRRFSWSARRSDGAPSPKEAPDKTDPHAIAVFDQYPAGAYPGNLTGKKASRPRRVLIENATVWTSGPEGVLQNASILIENGRIAALGTDVEKPNKPSHVIDASGKHITPGLVDCHSHTAISRGVNEGSHAVTCEVRIGDVVDPTDISIYRQLAGGLTTSNLLHGSANPMGGQNQVIKLRWGHDAEGLKLEGAKPGVKFALGENVKQANWGDDFTTRYPQTRMGVEQLMRDTFLAAREYGERKRAHAAREEKGLPFRTNLRLEAVLEILRGERIVHIHSYRQDEILMFVRLAQEFGFTVGTFQHVLEGYKVPHQLKEIDAGASSFSDWWAYKFEVYDAVPHNGALLHRAGVLTSFNSDDNELATRMNTEAAKAVKYGGVTLEEALKFVTINPAKQLRIDQRVGSLEVGKDADLAIWSGPPLSTLSRCEQTWIEGKCYFDIESDQKRREWVTAQRQALIAKVMQTPKKKKKDQSKDGEETEKPATLDFATKLRLLSPWGQYELIDHQGLYHDGQSLHACTGCYCDFR